MNTIIPISPINNLKTRLSEFLTLEERKNLLFNMLRDIFKALKGLNIYAISKDPEILEFCNNLGAKTIEEKGKGLNQALNQAFSVVNEDLLIVPADIPLIRESHIKEIKKLKEEFEAIIAPSRGGGTNLLYLSRASLINLRYEGFSFLKHLEEFKRNKVSYYIYDSFYLSIDINTPEDLGEIFIHGDGSYTKRYLESLNIKVEPKHSSAGRFKIYRE
ncbi:2-phospho-L-lactate guanylyltransferase CofC [Methanocaldococcus infernus ME]|uniref:2-phospho-L-lactate guanylyltransferase n=1 Tax=Methanocaldococcus infernus (strain DSM 11812 / JCM 15783 / ME) TaxID=573063 RepID=COFC_METIM|nr:2-phospho-L-lactate guanylyltransferase [Methanocaldococcus infernus]D5VSX2.1 RecName: Full=2-phospho-L-lactate guanylyltransferase; Short=LP guanylyltransferase [Methanocaldococcus infernus ME]ADG13675.1 2-phospho-L-lactate guanylyltransferase CofC [Methanocaldococcus infernus ME]